MSHKHHWELVEYDSGERHPDPRQLARMSVYDRLLTIEDYCNNPRVEYKKWICNCGKDRVYSKVKPSINTVIGRILSD
jgi:hypothetical protein